MSFTVPSERREQGLGKIDIFNYGVVIIGLYTQLICPRPRSILSELKTSYKQVIFSIIIENHAK